MKTVKLPNSVLVEEIYQLCLKCKIDWFYTDYYKKHRKTISEEDKDAIYYNVLDLGLDMSQELHQWFQTH